MAARREKGLCYNYDEKWNISHKCKAHFFLLVTNEDDELPLCDQTPEDPPADDHIPDSTEAQISFKALSVFPAPETFRIMGTISKQQLTILMDSGSTHNFVQERVAKFLGLPTLPSKSLEGMVGNGSVLDCHHFCPKVTILI